MTGSTWLAIVAMVAAANPPRMRPALPPSSGVVALGAAGSAALFVALAALADTALGAVDVSAPTMRVAAGLVLVGAGLRDLFVGAPSPDPALGGWGAALVPVMVPVTARPEIGVLAVSVGSVEGPGVVLVGAGLGGVALALLSMVVRSELADRVLRWAGRGCAVVVIATGVALTVAGIYAV